MVVNYRLYIFFIRFPLWLVLHPNALGLWETVVCICLRARIHSCEHRGHRKLRLGDFGVLRNIKNGIKTRDVAKYGLLNVNSNFICTHRFLNQFRQYIFIQNIPYFPWVLEWHLSTSQYFKSYILLPCLRKVEVFLVSSLRFPFWSIWRLKNIKSLKLKW